MDAILRTGEQTEGADVAFAAHHLSRLLRLFCFCLLPVYSLRALFALYQGAPFAAGLLCVFVLVLAYIPALFPRQKSFKRAALLANMALLLVEAGLVALSYVHLSQFLFVILVCIVFAALLEGILESVTVALLGLIFGTYFLYFGSSEELVFGIAPRHDEFALEFGAYMIATEVIVAALIIRFQQFLQAHAMEIQRRRVERSKSLRRLALAETSGRLAHEVNNPIAIMDGALRVLRRNLEWKNEEIQAKNLAYMEDAATRIGQLIAGVKLFSGTDNGDERQRVPVKELLRALQLQMEEKTRLLGVPLVASNHSLLDELECRPQQILFILSVLVDNALDASRHTRKPLHLRLRKHQGALRFELRDQGAGVGENDVEKIFTPFFTTKPSPPSMGMNLSLCRVMLEEEGGQIGFERHALGSTFWFELPAS